jgi:Rrf2 family protein
LREGKIIEAIKGAQGGYKLSRSAKKITFKEFLEALEGKCAVAECLRESCCCNKEKNCQVHPIFLAINDHIISYLDKLTLADLANYGKK